jgi:drug/metabolite transporter (DMT)-like permease
MWSVIFLLPLSLLLETPWNSSPTLQSTISLLYLGVIATGLAWLIRFRILTVNGLVFQTQVAYLIPIFGIIFGYFLMDEVITWRVIISLVVILIGIYIFKKNNKR